MRASIARATTSRGASSASGWTSGMNRRPSSSTRCAPSPRTASEIRNARPPTASAVGWNCTNSMSRSRRAGAVGERDAVAGRARAGWSCAAKSAHAPPVASSVIRARTSRSSSWPSSQAPAQPSPSEISASAAVCSSTVIRGSRGDPRDQRARRWRRRSPRRRRGGCGGGRGRPRGRAGRRRRARGRSARPARSRSAIRLGPLGDEDLDGGRVAEPAAGGDRVGGVLGGRVAVGRRRRPRRPGP